MKTLTLELLSPDKSFFSGPIVAVRVPGSQGSFAVLYNHAPIIALLSHGLVKVTLPEGATKSFQIKGGVIEVYKNQVVILAEGVSTIA
ncbi:MAG: ATP synthase F1 subunit epsilon [Bacteroidia bacterium]|nr:ATP synthase F1 subunit epsilon [Bacteroidia bacterium]MDW8157941.1 ATP synthase F1 subunit epsilon [Bacteroidia bacterium]